MAPEHAWEYIVVKLPEDADDWETMLNKLGVDRWELVSVAHTDSLTRGDNTWHTHHAVFRRRRG